MSVLAAHVLAVIVRQPPCYEDRSAAPEVKAAQLETIAEAIADAASSVPEGGWLQPLPAAGYLITIGYHESKWCLRVHSGEVRGGLGEGLWQLEGTHHGPDARSGLTVEATHSAARVALRQLQRSRQCGWTPPGVITAYAGRPCAQAAEGWPTLRSRVNGYWWAVSALRRAGAT